MKKIILNIIRAFIVTIFLFVLLIAASNPSKSGQFFVQDTDGTVYSYFTDGYAYSINYTDPSVFVKAVNAVKKIKNSLPDGGSLQDGAYYVVPGAASKPSAPSTSTASTPKAEPKCEHEYTSKVTKEATCKDKGITTYTCSKCGDSYTEEIDVTDEHDFIEEVVKEATCTEDGEIKNVCEICGYEEVSTIPRLEHIYKEGITKEATCTENGVKTFTCELCGDTYTEEIAATGHVEGEFEITKPNGMFTDGEQVKKCTVCNEVLATEIIPSKYPIWYLYCGIGALALIAIIVCVVVKKKEVKI